MFAVLQASAATPIDALVGVAQAFTPRFQVLGPFVVLDVGGLSALFGTPGELGGAIREACPACRSVALASTASTALLMACGREGLTVLSREEAQAALAALPIDVLVEVTQARLAATMSVTSAAPAGTSGSAGPGTGTAASTPAAMLSPSIGWRHPRDTHQAQHARRLRPRPSPPADMREALRALQQCAATVHRWGIRRLGALAALPRADVHARLGELGVSWQRLAAGEDDEPLVPWMAEPVFEEMLELEWPVEGFEPLSFVLARLFEPLAAALERADRGAVSIRTALHLTTRAVHLRQLPLPAPMRDPKTLRTLVLLDLESHPPSAAIDRVHVRVEPTPGRVLQWTLFDRAQPAPEQVATLVARLTALVGEGHVGSPARVDAWRPGAFRMEPFRVGREKRVPGNGAGCTGAGCGVPDTRTRRDWPDSAVRAAGEDAEAGLRTGHAHDAHGTSHPAPVHPAPLLPLSLRRFRLPIPVRVRVDDGRPARVTTDRRGITGGPIVQAAGPWRTSGEWWAGNSHGGGGRSLESGVELQAGEVLREGRADRDPEAGSGPFASPVHARQEPFLIPDNVTRLPTRSSTWDRDEWDIAMADGTVYRLFVERDVGQWFLEGVFD